MNQANSTGALILKSSRSCGRFGGFADLKILKRPRISPWFLLDGSRRCGRYLHITRICCIGGKYICVFTYMYSYRNTSGRPKRPGIVLSVSVMQTNQRVGLSPDRIADALCIENKEDSDERH